MNFGMITLNQSIKTEQNYVTWILTALLFILKLKIFLKNIADDVKKWFDTSNYNKDDNRKLFFLQMNQAEKLWKNVLELEQKHGHMSIKTQ